MARRPKSDRFWKRTRGWLPLWLALLCGGGLVGWALYDQPDELGEPRRVEEGVRIYLSPADWPVLPTWEDLLASYGLENDLAPAILRATLSGRSIRFRKTSPGSLRVHGHQ